MVVCLERDATLGCSMVVHELPHLSFMVSFGPCKKRVPGRQKAQNGNLSGRS